MTYFLTRKVSHAFLEKTILSKADIEKMLIRDFINELPEDGFKELKRILNFRTLDPSNPDKSLARLDGTLSPEDQKTMEYLHEMDMIQMEVTIRSTSELPSKDDVQRALEIIRTSTSKKKPVFYPSSQKGFIKHLTDTPVPPSD